MRLAVVLALLALPTHAATITSGAAPIGGSAIALDISTFVGSGRCGTGGSVVGDGCSTAIKSDPSAPNAYGRSGANPGDPWMDSNDMPTVAWAVDFDGRTVSSMSFRVTDAFDQRRDAEFGESFFGIAVGGSTWSILARQANATVDWITVAFDKAVDRATINFTTRANDGFGVSNVTANFCPVPR